MLSFYTSWKHQETFGFPMLSGSVKGNIGLQPIIIDHPNTADNQIFKCNGNNTALVS